MSKITSGDPRPAQGRKRQLEVAAEMKTAIDINSKIMLKGLNRPYTVAEAFIAETICALFFKARRLRDAGRDDVAVLTEAARLTQGSVFAVLAPEALPMPTIDPSEQKPPAPSPMPSPQ